METRKLYYEDCHLTDFTACVMSCEPSAQGYLITLDATAFYPEGGGQAWDTGTLGSVSVLQVQERGGEIFHLCDGPLSVGQQVAGKVDWARRFDLMQQHTGEHILSGIIHKTFGYHNMGFHVGAEVMEVDFDGPISTDALAEIEAAANKAIWENLPINSSCPDPEALKSIPYRSKREIPWPVRIVEIPGYDCCACCGVHTGATGEVGILKILSCVKLRQGVRLELVCGGRAYEYLRRVFEENRKVSQLFSATMLETGSAAEKMMQLLSAEKARNAQLQTEVFQCIADSYVNQANVLHFHSDLSSAQIRQLADAIASRCHGYAAVVSGSENAYGYCIVSRELDLTDLGKELTQTLRGRGGGKAGFQQGSVCCSREEILTFFSHCRT